MTENYLAGYTRGYMTKVAEGEGIKANLSDLWDWVQKGGEEAKKWFTSLPAQEQAALLSVGGGIVGTGIGGIAGGWKGALAGGVIGAAPGGAYWAYDRWLKDKPKEGATFTPDAPKPAELAPPEQQEQEQEQGQESRATHEAKKQTETETK